MTNNPNTVGSTSSRPETGPMRFPGDWTGVFVRGDDALIAAFYLKGLLVALEGNPYRNRLAKVIHWLESCDEKNANRPEPQDASQFTTPIAAAHPTRSAEVGR